MINPILLQYQMEQAGLPISWCNNTGFIEWLRQLTPAEQTLANQIIANHKPDDPLPWEQAEKDAEAGYTLLSDWVRTGTAIQAETYINGQIFNGQTQAQVEEYIDAMIKNITTANIAQINAQLANIRTVFKAAAGAIIAMRGLFIITAKLLIYIRDLVIRFRGE